MKDRHKLIVFIFLYIAATNYSSLRKNSKHKPVLSYLSNKEPLHNLYPTPTKLLKILEALH